MSLIDTYEKITQLDGTNYRSWGFSMKMLLIGNELWEVIEEDEDEGINIIVLGTDKIPEETGSSSSGSGSGSDNGDDAVRAKAKATKEWKRKDKLALSYIGLTLQPHEQEHIYSCQTAKAAWIYLKEIYQGKGIHWFLALLK
jgi:hypothetical protein